MGNFVLVTHGRSLCSPCSARGGAAHYSSERPGVWGSQAAAAAPRGVARAPGGRQRAGQARHLVAYPPGGRSSAKRGREGRLEAGSALDRCVFWWLTHQALPSRPVRNRIGRLEVGSALDRRALWLPTHPALPSRTFRRRPCNNNSASFQHFPF